jgi:hypothetical protein
MAGEVVDLFPVEEDGNEKGREPELPRISKTRGKTASRVADVVDIKKVTGIDQTVEGWADQLKDAHARNEREETHYAVVSGKRKRIETCTDVANITYAFDIKIYDEETDVLESVFGVEMNFDDDTKAEIYHRKVNVEDENVKKERRKGLGTYNVNLIKALLAQVARERGKPITIHLKTNQKDVIGLFRSCGFSEGPFNDPFNGEEIAKHFEFEVGRDEMS